MKAISKSWIILNLGQFERKINFNPPYQREGGKWNLQKKQRLLDSILRKYDLPKFYLAPSQVEGSDWEIVDGQQRIRAILEFLADTYPLGQDLDDLDGLTDISGKKYSELPTKAQEQIGMYELSITVLEDSNKQELEDLFRRLQEGVRITPTEYRNAISCEIRDFVVAASDHNVFKNTKINKTGWKWRELLDIITCLELAGHPVDVKARNLQEMYEYGKYPRFNKVSEKITKVLNYLENVTKIKTPFLDIKWGFIDLYWLISSLIDRYDLKGLESEFAQFYKQFEGERRKAIKKDFKQLAQGSNSDKLLFDYINAFQTAPGTKASLEKRALIYRTWFFRMLGDKDSKIVLKDPRRNYDHIDRSILWYMVDGKCQSCNKEISLENMEADHIIPYARGGQTILENAQCLCRDCNRQKSAKI